MTCVSIRAYLYHSGVLPLLGLNFLIHAAYNIFRKVHLNGCNVVGMISFSLRNCSYRVVPRLMRVTCSWNRRSSSLKTIQNCSVGTSSRTCCIRMEDLPSDSGISLRRHLSNLTVIAFKLATSLVATDTDASVTVVPIY